MANGQPFDQNDPTIAANNEYPMGTWLRVTNPRNGKSVVVQVRDRGGFGAGLDLSRAAYFALDPPNGWGFTVQYQPVPGPDATPPAPAPSKPKTAGAPSPPPALPAVKGDEYVVQAGDTLRRISQAVGVPVEQLAQLNGLSDPNAIGVGQKLQLRPKAKLYTVQPGDTLNNIAQTLGTDRSALLAANDIADPDVLTPGQLIRLPA
jgi:LysM repeat protein